MTVEIRPVTQDEMETFHHNVRIGFSAPLRPRDQPERPPEILPEWTLCAFDDGELATTYAALPFTLHMNGRTMPAAGVTAVTTQPWHRRRGHLRRIMETDFARMHEGGPSVAILYASMAAIYQRFGYSVVSTHLRYAIEPRYIEFAYPVQARGRMRRLSRDDLSAIKPLYERVAAERTGYLRRTEWDWQNSTIGYDQEPPLIAVYEEDGNAQGYVIYWAERKEGETFRFGGDVRVAVGDFIWRTPAAYQALWDFLRRTDLAREITCWRMPADDPAPDLLLEPRMLYAMQMDGILARIVDVQRAPTERGYDGEGRVTFEVQDEMAPWNAGRWELEAGAEGACMRRTDRDAEVSMSINTVAPLLFGHLSASQAARMGRLTANDASALPRWDALLRTRVPPACANGF